MNDLQSIIDAFREARGVGRRAAWATVVGVEGSAYRRPGARMLITEDGRTAGSISGGCLERDTALRALRVIESQTALAIEYDTRSSEDIVWGMGLGCNGVVRVLLESLHQGSSAERALQFMADCLCERSCGLVATVIAVSAGPRGNGSSGLEIGERMLLDSELNICGEPLNDAELVARIRVDALDVLSNERGAIRTYETSYGRAQIFFDLIAPPPHLVICGAEHDALPLLHLGHTLGWRVTVVDARQRRASKERFAEADEVLLCRAEDVAAHVSLSETTAIVIMTHNYLHDVELLRALLPSPARYLGILGPKERTSKLLEEIRTDVFGLASSQFARLHSPVGMDIGAETPEEIAISIICEIKAVWAARGGGFLRDRNAPIHDKRSALASINIPAASPAGKTISTVDCHVS